MLESIVKMDPALHAVLYLHPDDIKQGDVKSIIEDRQFWAGAGAFSARLSWQSRQRVQPWQMQRAVPGKEFQS